MNISRAICAISLGSLAVPAVAQDAGRSLSLDDLIPDSAVENPEEWASQGDSQPPSVQTADEVETVVQDAAIMPVLDMDTELADLPEFDLPWPDGDIVPEIAELEPEEGVDFAEATAAENAGLALPEGYEVKVARDLALVLPTERTLFPEQDEFIDRFDALSVVDELEGDEDNIAVLAARARQDQDLLQQLLRTYGYYNGQIIREIGRPNEVGLAAETPPPPGGVRFAILPGRQYRFGAIDLGDLNAGTAPFGDANEARAEFGIQSGDPLLSDRIIEQQYNLDRWLGENGYPFATIGEPELLVDHNREEGDLTLSVMPQGKYAMGQITSSLPEFLSGKHFAKIARFDAGDTYQRSDELDLRRAILATGLVASVSVTPREAVAPIGSQPGTVDLDIDITQAPLRTIAGSIGYGTGEGLRVAASWEHRNFFPPEGMIRFRGVVGTREQLAGVTFRKNNWNGRDRILTLDAYASRLRRDAFDARTTAFLATYEKVSNLLFQKDFTWGVGIELTATGEREEQADGSLGPRETFFVGALPMRGLFDESDDLLDPTKGWRLGGQLSPEYSVRDGVESQYVRGEVEGSFYIPTSDKIVLAGRAKFASISGAETAEVAPSRRLYAGGGGSVRGFGYQAIGPQNDEGDPIGGRSLVELSAEARIRTGFLDGAVSVVPFVDAGSVANGSTPTFDDIKIGAGIGMRYHTGFGPIRVDIGVPLNPGPDDEPVGVYVSLGQAF